MDATMNEKDQRDLIKLLLESPNTTADSLKKVIDEIAAAKKQEEDKRIEERLDTILYDLAFVYGDLLHFMGFPASKELDEVIDEVLNVMKAYILEERKNILKSENTKSKPNNSDLEQCLKELSHFFY